MFEKITVGAASRAKPAAIVVGVFKDKKLDRGTAALDDQIARAVRRTRAISLSRELISVTKSTSS